MARGYHVQVIFNEKQALEPCIETLRQERIGLWTTSEAVTYFDDLRFYILY